MPARSEAAHEREARLACNCCPRTYTWAEYLALPPAAGGSRVEVDDGVFAEMRNCSCGATMARVKGEA